MAGFMPEPASARGRLQQLRVLQPLGTPLRPRLRRYGARLRVPRVHPACSRPADSPTCANPRSSVSSGILSIASRIDL